jgi:hypothetical protein
MFACFLIVKSFSAGSAVRNSSSSGSVASLATSIPFGSLGFERCLQQVYPQEYVNR